MSDEGHHESRFFREGSALHGNFVRYGRVLSMTRSVSETNRVQILRKIWLFFAFRLLGRRAHCHRPVGPVFDCLGAILGYSRSSRRLLSGVLGPN